MRPRLRFGDSVVFAGAVADQAPRGAVFAEEIVLGIGHYQCGGFVVDVYRSILGVRG
jgi:hypothetical protein